MEYLLQSTTTKVKTQVIREELNRLYNLCELL